jgi:putative transposase
MSSYRQITYQIVFETKYRKPAIPYEHKLELYKYIAGIMRNKNCKLHNINGVEDHIHILCDLHPSIALADLVKDIKVATSIWMKTSGKFPGFTGWAEGYGAFTYAFRNRAMISKYIENQEEHHKKISFKKEYIQLLNEFGIEYDEKFI